MSAEILDSVIDSLAQKIAGLDLTDTELTVLAEALGNAGGDEVEGFAATSDQESPTAGADKGFIILWLKDSTKGFDLGLLGDDIGVPRS